jgi:C4-dicarboxylate-specific signal transduction histidine kinase
MKNYLKILELKLADKQIAPNEFQILNAEIDRVASIVGSLANATGQAEPKLEQISVNELISDLLAICKISLFDPVGIHMETQLDAEIPLVFSDKTGLKQVFMNLLKNAAEAMPHGGVLKLTSATLINDRRDSAAAITITDTGPGIPKDRLNQIFLPMQTQKGAANAGLGLSISADILKNINASITCKSTLGVGTAFEVILPLNPPKK